MVEVDRELIGRYQPGTHNPAFYGLSRLWAGRRRVAWHPPASGVARSVVVACEVGGLEVPELVGSTVGGGDEVVC